MNGKAWSVWIGFEPREVDAFAVCRKSIRQHLTIPIPVRGIVLSDVKKRGLYRRHHEVRDGQLWDVISDAPCSTEFACSRFLAPIMGKEGWALFMDCDMLVRVNLAELFRHLDDRYAVYCVKHQHDPDHQVKMDGAVQTRYARKNWSSVVVYNCDHEANKALSVETVNSLPGRDLHRFCWLKDEEIGELGPEWNWLVGVSDPVENPKIVHFTEGLPSMRGYEHVPFADEWRAVRDSWAL